MSPGTKQSTAMLEQRLAEAEATIAALLSGEIDAVIAPGGSSPLLLANAQSALRESEARFRQLAESIEQVFFLRDPLLTAMLYVSPAYERVFGLSRDALYADPRAWREVIHPDDLQRVDETILRPEAVAPFEIEYRIIRPDGAERILLSRGFPVPGELDAGPRFASIVEDITDRKQLESQVLQSSRMDAVGQMASGIAHDFNNLLTVILVAIECAAEALPQESGAADGLDEAMNAARRGADLVRQLLAFSRQQVLDAQPFDLNAIIVEMTVMLGRVIGKQIAIVTRLAPDLPLLTADASQIQQVVMNLVLNARDAMASGGQLVLTTSVIEASDPIRERERLAPGPYVRLTVQDTGSGMTRETKERLFEPFYTTKGVDKGTGLGLSTSYGIVMQSKGHISVESELGRGTTFSVCLPCMTVATDPRAGAPRRDGPAA